MYMVHVTESFEMKTNGWTSTFVTDVAVNFILAGATDLDQDGMDEFLAKLHKDGYAEHTSVDPNRVSFGVKAMFVKS